MKKVVLLACVIVVSGFASSCSFKLSDLNREIERYNKECTNLNFAEQHSFNIKRKCQELEEKVRKAEYELNKCREERNDDIARKFNSIYR